MKKSPSPITRSMLDELSPRSRVGWRADRSINIIATETLPEALRNLPALNVDFG
jgi:hypothetical protein